MILSYLSSFGIAIMFVLAPQEAPRFKGGQRNLISFISQSLIYPEYSKQNCLQGTVHVNFQLSRKGKIFNSRIEKGFGTDLDDEALRIVRLTSGRWTVPATFDTTQFLSIPINFSLQEYNCEQKSKEDIRGAIAAYKANTDLTRAITNFYQKKNAGQYDQKDEPYILSLKEQLGYNERFIDRTIRQAQQKLKQGDRESACEDLNFVRNLGSDKANELLKKHCR